MTRTHRILIGVVVAGAVVIAGIGFAGSYAAVRSLALQKGFGNFSYVFPIGIDAGICVLLALDLLLTWIRIPFPLLRQTAWLLTAATIAFNGAAAWPDPLGVGMHAVIPILFVVSVEAARHAVGRIADITADKHMEGVRLTRWLLSPLPTFLLWRRMKLWELRSYEAVIKLEQERLVYQARLRSRFGRAWRRKAPVESLMPLRLARYGVPLAEMAPAGLVAAGVEPQLLPRRPQAPQLDQQVVRVEPAAGVLAQTAPSHGFAAPRQTQHPGDHDAEVEPPMVALEQEHQSWHEEHPERMPVPHPQEQEHQAPVPDASGGEPDKEWASFYRSAAEQFATDQGYEPDADELSLYLLEQYDVADQYGRPLAPEYLAPYVMAANREAEAARGVAVGDQAPVNASRAEDAGRVAVQMRISELERSQSQEAPAAEPTGEAPAAGTGTLAEPEPSGAAPTEAKPSGIDLVEFHYRQLPPESQGKSAKALAPELAALSGYAEGTVRKYIGEMRRRGSSEETG
ncbi:DUF2637 domain-containing protein [Streptomyces sp. NBC_01445]|uniref:DUF2637 domain-containing protein n=1 Tax=Streptomyces sp. NBC_01445 TaxID=2903869 RepID=UPI002DDB5B56|nr:DUF2637 domain-containing protein [Streptomyces sp. NBC_01445]WSE10383.1 DUF2637 domain-containing protein [Streptomyces sp. NBC_01445]WSE11032.1 DUF2637 domain-containing protein [Streptomyces sp. NBC_01445]WSE11815.1 DUF2637 domain-containing protein [Streptomyces sp. NBC_01445]